MNKIIEIRARVRYPEDADLNGVEDDNENPKMPCMKEICNDEFEWDVLIDIETGRITNWTVGNEAIIHYKVCDECKVIHEDMEDYDDYVPDFLGIDDQSFGDYIILTIDKDGFIKNWNTEECKKFINEHKKGSNV